MVLFKFSFKVHYKLRNLFVGVPLLYTNKIQIKEYFLKISTQFYPLESYTKQMIFRSDAYKTLYFFRLL